MKADALEKFMANLYLKRHRRVNPPIPNHEFFRGTHYLSVLPENQDGDGVFPIE